MLVLSRRPNQVVHIHTSDGIIEVHLNDCNESQARLGFVAPASVKIMREEIDSPHVKGRHISMPKMPVSDQIKTITSLLRALFTRGSAGRQ